METIALMSGVFFASLALSVLGVWIGMLLVKAESRSIGRATIITGIFAAFGVIASVVPMLFQRSMNDEQFEILNLVMGGVVLVCIPLLWYVIKNIARTTFWRAAVIWIVHLVFGFVMVAVLFAVIKPYLFEAFVVPTNSMAPSIIGWHSIGKCPHCGAQSIIPDSDPRVFDARFVDDREERAGTCPTCGKFGKSASPKAKLMGPDRIFVNKVLAPRRWDIVEFRYPLDPKVKYVDRLVGLPGETIFLEDGAVWVNGVKTPLPENVGKWAYAANLGDDMPTPMGSRETPWQLKDDECCVLGDFGWNSSDSRHWGVVPMSNIEGVVAVRYWPPSRWAILR